MIEKVFKLTTCCKFIAYMWQSDWKKGGKVIAYSGQVIAKSGNKKILKISFLSLGLKKVWCCGR